MEAAGGVLFREAKQICPNFLYKTRKCPKVPDARVGKSVFISPVSFVMVRLAGAHGH